MSNKSKSQRRESKQRTMTITATLMILGSPFSYGLWWLQSRGISSVPRDVMEIFMVVMPFMLLLAGLLGVIRWDKPRFWKTCFVPGITILVSHVVIFIVQVIHIFTIWRWPFDFIWFRPFDANQILISLFGNFVFLVVHTLVPFLYTVAAHALKEPAQ